MPTAVSWCRCSFFLTFNCDSQWCLISFCSTRTIPVQILLFPLFSHFLSWTYCALVDWFLASYGRIISPWLWRDRTLWRAPETSRSRDTRYDGNFLIFAFYSKPVRLTFWRWLALESSNSDSERTPAIARFRSWKVGTLYCGIYSCLFSFWLYCNHSKTGRLQLTLAFSSI